jgi:hypothetical protein
MRDLRIGNARADETLAGAMPEVLAGIADGPEQPPRSRTEQSLIRAEIMSDTPRTDKAAYEESCPSGWVVDRDFARTLERENAALREANDKIGRKAALVQALREEICEAEWGSNAAGAAMFFEFIRKWTRHIDATESTARLPCKHVFSAELNDAGDCVMAVTCDKCGIPEDIARSDADELADEAKQSQPGRGCGICDSVPTAQCDKPDCPSLSAGDGQ